MAAKFIKVPISELFEKPLDLTVGELLRICRGCDSGHLLMNGRTSTDDVAFTLVVSVDPDMIASLRALSDVGIEEEGEGETSGPLFS